MSGDGAEPPPFDIGFSFDARLREVPNDTAAMTQAVDWLEARARAAATPRDAAHALGMAGALARMLGEFARAQRLLEAALAACPADDEETRRLATVNALRLAHVFQQRCEYATADAMFARLIDAVAHEPALSALRATALQHAGKNAFDQGRLAAAERQFAEALALRVAAGQDDLAESSRHALAVTRGRLAGRA